MLRRVARTGRGGRFENGDDRTLEEPPGTWSLVHAAPDDLRIRCRPRAARRWSGRGDRDLRGTEVSWGRSHGRWYGRSNGMLYLLIRGDLTQAEVALTMVATVLVAAASLASYIVYRKPRSGRKMVKGIVFGMVRVVRRRYRRREADELVDRLVDRLGEELGSLRQQFRSRPLEVLGWCCLAFGYWAFDATCLVLVFLALGVPAGTGELLVAYGIATAAGSLPLTPGGIGVFEAAMLATLAVFGIGAEGAIPILGYRLFNFWMPIPLAAFIYPTLRIRKPAGRGGTR